MKCATGCGIEWDGDRDYAPGEPIATMCEGCISAYYESPEGRRVEAIRRSSVSDFSMRMRLERENGTRDGSITPKAVAEAFRERWLKK